MAGIKRGLEVVTVEEGQTLAIDLQVSYYEIANIKELEDKVLRELIIHMILKE